VAEAEEAGVTEFFWADEITDLFDKIETALQEGRIQDGWRYFHGVRRLEVYGLEAVETADPNARMLETRAGTVREEALDTLGGWRKRSVEELLGRDELKENVSGVAVRQALSILHEQYESVHLKRDHLQLQFNQLFWLGFVSSLSFLVLSAIPSFVNATYPVMGPLASFLEPPFVVTRAGTVTLADPNVASAGFAVFVMIAGVVGASLFGMRTLRNQSLSTKVAQRITGFTLTSARGFFGAVGAMIFYFLLQTPFMTVGENTAAVMIVVGFAAGYSERMVSVAVDTVAKATRSSESEK
jgi:hypothetical protein